MGENQTIEELIKGCTLYFEEHCYTKTRIERYKAMWKSGICRHMKDKGICYYNRSVGEGFTSSAISTEVTPGERDMIRSVNVLTEWQETGKVSKRTVHSKVLKLTGSIGQAIENLLHYLKGLRRSQTTINEHLIYLYRFNQYLENEGIHLLEDICERHVLSFVSTLTNNRINVVSSLRMFFRHLYVERVLRVDLSYVLANYKWVKREKLPSYYTGEEVKQIESTVSCSSKVGKRDYAVLLLASRLGLRASDIAGLSFSHLDWEKSRIVFKQCKTGKEIELPLLAEIGVAIINYLKHGRPQSDSAHVFLSARAPYRPMTGQAVSSAVRYIIDASGISTKQRKRGPHSMRHSLASRLLEHSVSLPVISETLGHKTTQTTMTYLRIDTTALRRCALDVPMVDAAFYLQEGGAFYGNL
jgi:site-specific recombinase XerD